MILTAYLLAGGILDTAERVTIAQGDQILQHEMRLRTEITIDRYQYDGNTLHLYVNNTGSESIRDFSGMEVYVTNASGVSHYTHPSGWSIESITPDVVYPGQLDPGETLALSLPYAGGVPAAVRVVTGNGVYDSVYLSVVP